MWTGKLVFVSVALCCSASAQVAEAQPKPTPRFETRGLFFLDISKISWKPAVSLPSTWQTRFLPPRPGQSFEMKSASAGLEIGGGFEPRVNAGSWQVGLPIFYKIGSDGSPYARERSASFTRLFWWNEVILQRTSIRRTSPAVGLSVVKGLLRLQLSGQKVSLYEENYVGQDCIGCTNTSKPLEKHKLGGGWARRVDAYLYAKNCMGLGWFYEKAPLVSITGFTMVFDINLKGNAACE